MKALEGAVNESIEAITLLIVGKHPEAVYGRLD
jgi:hypothetical protein